MHTNGHCYSSPETARPHSGEANAPASGRRARGRHPRTIGAKAGVAAFASVSAASLALTLAAGPAGAAARPAWAMTAGNIQSMSQQNPGTTSHFFNTPTAYGNGASLVRTPIQKGYATTPVLGFTSYAQFKADIANGSISYPYKWVMYDPEVWTYTPVSEQQNPIKYMTLFGQLARAHGFKVIQAPALDLAWAPGSVLPIQRHESGDQWFVRVNLAGAAAAAGDVFDLQNESNTRAVSQYAQMYKSTASQARAANAKVKVFSEVAADDGTAAQMATAAKSVSPDGFYVAAAGHIPTTLQFFNLMKAAGY